MDLSAKLTNPENPPIEEVLVQLQNCAILSGILIETIRLTKEVFTQLKQDLRADSATETAASFTFHGPYGCLTVLSKD